MSKTMFGMFRKVNDLLERLTGLRLVKRVSEKNRHVAIARNKYLVYQSLSEVRRRVLEETTTAEIDLRLAELKVFSQNGEDGIIIELINGLNLINKSFVEFGVEDGTECNTRFLAEVLGWSGVYFEPNSNNFEKLRGRWERSERISVWNQSVTPEKIADQFEAAHVPLDFGLLSIDVDGQDYWIWSALPDRYRPSIVIIESNTCLSVEQFRVEIQGLEWTSDFSDSMGASVEALKKLGTQRGYTLVHVDLSGVNAFFVRDDLLLGRVIVGLTDRGPNYELAGIRHGSKPARPSVDLGPIGDN